MSEFLMLFRGGDAPMASFSPEQIQAHMQKWGVWMTKLFEEERVLSSEPLFPTGRTLQFSAFRTMADRSDLRS